MDQQQILVRISSVVVMQKMGPVLLLTIFVSFSLVSLSPHHPHLQLLPHFHFLPLPFSFCWCCCPQVRLEAYQFLSRHCQLDSCRSLHSHPMCSWLSES